MYEVPATQYTYMYLVVPWVLRESRRTSQFTFYIQYVQITTVTTSGSRVLEYYCTGNRYEYVIRVVVCSVQCMVGLGTVQVL